MIKKGILVILGIILSLVLLECGLRLAGFTISTYQQYKNNKALKNKSQYTIMCLGESTTQGQYSIQLQEILDEKYPNSFSVIDCGLGGTNLKTILEFLDENINKYKPNIAICMMGINDGLVFCDNKDSYNEYMNKELKLNLKVFKLFVLLKKHIQTLLETKKVFAQNIDNNNLKKLFYKYQDNGDYEKAEKLLKTMLKTRENEEWAFVELAMLYADYMLQKDLGYKMAIEGIEKNYNFKKEWYYKVVFEYNYKMKNIQTLRFYIDKALNKDIEIFSSDIKYFLYGYIKNYITQEEKKKILKIMVQNDDRYYGMLAIESIEQKDYRKAQEYFNKAEEIRLNYPNIETYNLYKLIVKKFMDNNIKVICMQYPVRSILPLQEQLKKESYYDKITFISNEKLFKEALMKKSYDEIFFDQFSGDFGHCIDLGNTMIAENIVKTLEKLVN